MSKVVGCTLERFGELPNEFHDGACGTFEFSSGEERVMFCFSKNRKKKCFRLAQILNLLHKIFQVTMEKLMPIIPTQSTTITTRPLPILITKWLRLVVIQLITIKLRCLISTPINGQQKVLFRFAPPG